MSLYVQYVGDFLVGASVLNLISLTAWRHSLFSLSDNSLNFIIILKKDKQKYTYSQNIFHFSQKISYAQK